MSQDETTTRHTPHAKTAMACPKMTDKSFPPACVSATLSRVDMASVRKHPTNANEPRLGPIKGGRRRNTPTGEFVHGCVRLLGRCLTQFALCDGVMATPFLIGSINLLVLDVFLQTSNAFETQEGVAKGFVSIRRHAFEMSFDAMFQFLHLAVISICRSWMMIVILGVGVVQTLHSNLLMTGPQEERHFAHGANSAQDSFLDITQFFPSFLDRHLTRMTQGTRGTNHGGGGFQAAVFKHISFVRRCKRIKSTPRGAMCTTTPDS